LPNSFLQLGVNKRELTLFFLVLISVDSFRFPILPIPLFFRCKVLSDSTPLTSCIFVYSLRSFKAFDSSDSAPEMSGFVRFSNLRFS
jgi:hypothetical protein